MTMYNRGTGHATYLYIPLLDCLEAIGNDAGSKCDPKSKTEANGLLHQIQSSGFIVSFQTAAYAFGYTESLSHSLQGRSLDVIDGYAHVKTVMSELDRVRDIARKPSVLCTAKQKQWQAQPGCPQLCLLVAQDDRL